jgi:putative aldouronate transport system permease protein
MRTFYKTNVPNEILESARIDGAGEWRILLQIVLPLSTPGLATVALFSAIGIWNNFFNCLLLVDDAKYYSLQFTIYTTLNNIRFLLENADKMVGLVNVSELPSQTFRMAMAVVTVGPIILAYPFFQRYFIRGLTIGAVKG